MPTFGLLPRWRARFNPNTRNRRAVVLVLEPVHPPPTVMTRSLLWLALFGGFATTGCSSGCGKNASTDTDASVAAVASVPTVADASQPDAHVASPLCRVKVPTFVVDRGVRLDTGVTLAAWTRSAPIFARERVVADGGERPEASVPSDPADATNDSSTPAGSGRIAFGYAKANGKPFVAEVSEDAHMTLVDVPSTLEALETKPETGVRRVVSRVVPLAPTSFGADASVDYVEIGSDKTRRVHCGPASGGPYVSTSGPSLTLGAPDVASETVDCKTVPREGGFFALESTLTVDGTNMVAELVLGKTRLMRRETPIKGSEKPSERYAFTLLGYARGEGLVAASARFNGNVVVATAASDLSSPRDEAFWLGTATNAPSPAFVGSDLFVWATLNAKPEVYLSRTAFDPKTNKLGKIPKPMPISLGEDAPGLEERGTTSADGALRLLVVPEKVGGKKVIRLHAFEKKDGVVLPPFTLGEADEPLVEAKVIATPSGDVLVATISLDKAFGATLKATVLTCERSASSR